MNNKLILLCLFVIILGFSGLASGEEFVDENPWTIDNQIDEIIKTNYSLNPEVFEKLKNEKDTLAIYGIIPEKNPGIEAYEWWISIDKISESMATDKALKEYYLNNGGPIFGFGPEKAGYILVYINPNYEKEISEEQLANIRKIIEIYAQKENLKNIPIVISYEDIPELEYNQKHRPLVGGVHISDNNSWIGTVGYTVKRGKTYGFVTAAHCIGYTNNTTVYQPSKSILSNNTLGKSLFPYPHIDAAFIPYNNSSNVSAKIYIENSSYSNGTNLSVGGYYNIKSINDIVWKSGSSTGLTQGNLTGYIYAYQTNNTTHPNAPEVFIMGKIAPHISAGGDSGSPIFVIRDDGKAYLVGVLHGGYGEFNVDGYTYFTPNGEIMERLNVTPLTM